MADYKVTKVFTAVASGAQNETITLSDPYQQYIVTSGSISYTAADSLTITFSGTAYYGMVVDIHFNTNITLANHVDAKIVITDGVGSYTIKGDGSGNLPAIFSKSRFTLKALYNGSTWSYRVIVSADATDVITSANLAEGAVDTTSIAAEAVTLAKIEDLTRGSIITGQTASNRPTALAVGAANRFLQSDGTDVAWVALSGDATLSAGAITIAANAVTNAKLAGMTRGTIKVGNAAGAASDLTVGTASQFLGSDGTDVVWRTMSGDATLSAGAITIGAGVIEQTMLDSETAVEIIPLLVSFEAAGGTVPSVGDFKIKMPYPGTVSEIYGYVVKAIANTDAGTIQAKNNAGTNMTAGLITCAISDPRGTAYTVSPTADNTFIAGDILTFTTAKVTAGGLVQLSIKVTRT